jgi:beta-N-acetylhexosaminidase
VAGPEWNRALGQLLMVGVPGGRPSPDWERRFSDLAPAGVILFRRNVESSAAVRALTGRLQDLAAAGGFAPLLIAADEEGGFLSPILGLEEPSPAAMALGTAGSETLAFESARTVGARLRRAGVNLNLAPCLDVNDEPTNPVIGPRSFGSDPKLVSRLGARTVEGLRAGGVLTAAKHFPGHGSTTRDSHRTLPMDRRSWEDLRRGALPPFEAAIHAGVDLIMTAHVAFPALTGRDDEPATFSPRLVRGLLREEMGFGGVVITDALEMAGASGNRTPEQAALLGFRAGVDLLLHAEEHASASDIRRILGEALENGELTEERIAESLERIRVLKENIPSPGAESDRDVFREARRRGIRILADPAGLIPLRMDPDDRLGVLVPDPDSPEGCIDVRALETDIRSRHARLEVVRAERGVPAALENLDACDTILAFVSSRGPLDSRQESLVRQVCALSRPLVLAAVFNPWVLPEAVEGAARIATFDFSPPALEALVERLFDRPGR